MRGDSDSGTVESDKSLVGPSAGSRCSVCILRRFLCMFVGRKLTSQWSKWIADPFL